MLTKKALGKRIKKAREAKGWTQFRLARAIGLNQSEISKIETGVRDIGVIQLDRLARALDVPLIELIYGKGKY